MKKFETYEQIAQAYPLNGAANQIWCVFLQHKNILSKDDLKYCYQKHRNGWYDKIEHRWYYYSISNESWYTHYIYDGLVWSLGLDTWDGIVEADEPEVGLFWTMCLPRREYGKFRTLGEAVEYVEKKLKERLEF